MPKENLPEWLATPLEAKAISDREAMLLWARAHRQVVIAPGQILVDPGKQPPTLEEKIAAARLHLWGLEREAETLAT